MADIEERIRTHERAFEGLLALTPAKYWDSGNQDDQWLRKKASKEQRKQAKRAKLDPNSNKTAKDLLEEKEKKRKRETEDSENIPEADASSDDNTENTPATESSNGVLRSGPKRKKISNGLAQTNGRSQPTQNGSASKPQISALAPLGLSQRAKLENASNKLNSTPKPAAKQNVDSKAEAPATPAIPPPALAQTKSTPTPKEPPLPELEKEALRNRLNAKIEALRAARKADGNDGKPVRTRQELIEARRQKEVEKKELKKQRRKQAMEEERQQQQQANEAELARLRGSGSPVSDIFSPASPQVETALTYGRVAFDDGTKLDNSMEAFLNPRKKKKLDAKAALSAAQRKLEKLQKMDEESRLELLSKDTWLNAKKRAHGEKVKDDVGLLKKSIKRKEKLKQKSAKEWQERKDSVDQGREMRQKKREENLRKRRDEKGVKRGGKKGKKASRPGFEGSFKARPKK